MRKIIKIESPGSSDYDESVCSVSSDGASQKTNKQKQTKTKQKQNKNKTKTKQKQNKNKTKTKKSYFFVF